MNIVQKHGCPHVDYNLLEYKYMPGADTPCNVADALHAMARLSPDTPAIIYPNGRVRHTYHELSTESCQLAAGLLQAGFRNGMRTALLVPPSPELFALTFALFRIGAVPVFIDPGIGAGNFGKCLADAEPEAFVGTVKAHLLRKIMRWAKETVRLSIVVNGSALWGVPLSKIRADGMARSLETAAATTTVDTAAILFTSGSTGPPKGVIYTHGTFAAQISILRQTYQISPGEVDLPTFPLFALFAPALGMTSLIPDMDFTRPGSVDPKAILGPVTAYSATTMFGSPALLNRVGRYGAMHNVRLPCLKRVISAGAPVAPVVLQRFSSLLTDDAEIFTPYGATEALPVCSIGSREIIADTGRMTGEGHGVCVGRPVTGTTVAIIPVSDSEITDWSTVPLLSPCEVGEIAVKGRQVSAGYYNNPAATLLSKIHDPDGGFWHRMGDLGYLDHSGRLWFCGRKAHRVITARQTLYTIPVEGVFNTHPRVFRTALVGIGVPGRQIPVLCVELEAGISRREQGQIRDELFVIGSSHPHTREIKSMIFHPGFPVDIRHNAKIFREKLALWAERRLT